MGGVSSGSGGLGHARLTSSAVEGGCCCCCCCARHPSKRRTTRRRTGASARIRVRDGAIAACADIVRARGWVGRSRRAKGCARRAAGRRLGAGLRRLGVNVRRAGVVHGENEPHGVAPAFCTEKISTRRRASPYWSPTRLAYSPPPRNSTRPACESAPRELPVTVSNACRAIR